MNIKTKEPNPSSKGEVEAPIVMIDKFDVELNRILASKNKSKTITLHVHPFVASYLKKGVFSIQVKWFFKHKKWIHVLPRDAYQYLQYRFEFR
jgi:ribonuclease G